MMTLCFGMGVFSSCGGGGNEVERLCADGLDNDADGLTDCQDPDCAAAPSCAGTCNYNGLCEAGETAQSCPTDCGVAPVCGNGTCELGETNDNCPQDCPVGCGNGTCDAGETPQSCPTDCGVTPVCGNGTCETGETADNCPADCVLDAGLDAGGDGGTPCVGWCAETCTEAAQLNTHIGCEFWPTPTANSQLLAPFDNNFGVLVFNPNSLAATVTLTRGGVQVGQQTVAAGQSHEFTLPLNTGLKLTSTAEESVQVADAAYHLTATAPVAAYQFNPLDFEISGEYSHSNDAALLLPVHALSGEYVVMARQTFGVDSTGGGTFTFIPGFFTVVGTANNTTVTINFSAYTQVGPGLTAYQPGQVGVFTVDAGEALQIVSERPATCTGTQTSDDCNGIGGTCVYCDMGPTYDLTGTSISATAPVAVYSGHVCSFVPYNYWACDHLEEQAFPRETWGQQVVVSRTEPQHDVGFSIEPNVIRVLSGMNSNTITFSPAQSIGASVTLNQGDWVEFEALDNFVVNGTAPLLVSQFLVGQNMYTSALQYRGDPAMGLVAPVDQYRNYYAFMIPNAFAFNYVNVVKPATATVLLDGAAIGAAQFGPPVGSSTYVVARIPITGNAHTMTSTDPFSIFVYGVAEYTSYMYPGGLGLTPINP